MFVISPAIISRKTYSFTIFASAIQVVMAESMTEVQHEAFVYGSLVTSFACQVLRADLNQCHREGRRLEVKLRPKVSLAGTPDQRERELAGLLMGLSLDFKHCDAADWGCEFCGTATIVPS